MNELPPGWVWAELADVCSSVTDGDHQAPPQVQTGIPFLVIGNIRNHQLDFKNCRHVPPEYFKALHPTRRPQKGDVLYSLVGSYGIPVQVKTNTSFCVQRHIGILRPSSEISPGFLALVLRSRAVFDQATQYATGTAQLTVSLSGLRRIRIPLPPRAEQERIVVAIEEEFSRLDAGVLSLERTQQNLARVHAAVLEAAVPPAGGNIPKVPLGDLVASGRKIAYGVLVPGDHDPDGVPFVRVGDLSNRRVNIQGLKRISPAIAARYPRTRLQGGEVLLSLVGTIGRIAIVSPELAGANAARALAVIPIREQVEPRYVAIALSRDRVTQELVGLAHEVARKTLNLEDVRRYEIPLPTYPEQLEIVKAVETRETWIRSIEEVVARSFRRADHLRSSILKDAFSGRLVPQDESDEPASALLARIACERASTNNRGSGRKRNLRLPREEATV